MHVNVESSSEEMEDESESFALKFASSLVLVFTVTLPDKLEP